MAKLDISNREWSLIETIMIDISLIFVSSVILALIAYYELKLYKITTKQDKKFANRLSSVIFGVVILSPYFIFFEGYYFVLYVVLYFTVLPICLYLFVKTHKKNFEKILSASNFSKPKKIEAIALTILAAIASTTIYVVPAGYVKIKFIIWIFAFSTLCVCLIKEVFFNKKSGFKP